MVFENRVNSGMLGVIGLSKVLQANTAPQWESDDENLNFGDSGPVRLKYLNRSVLFRTYSSDFLRFSSFARRRLAVRHRVNLTSQPLVPKRAHHSGTNQLGRRAMEMTEVVCPMSFGARFRSTIPDLGAH